MQASDRMGIAVVFSVLLATFTVSPLTSDSSFFGVSWLLILILGGSTIAMRRARLASGTVPTPDLGCGHLRPERHDAGAR